MLINKKEIFVEKLTKPFSSHYLCRENHTNDCRVVVYEDWRDIDDYLEENGFNFLGITTPPYNPYGKHLNFAFVIEDKNNDYKILWHHVSDMWLDKIAISLDIELRFRKTKNNQQ